MNELEKIFESLKKGTLSKDERTQMRKKLQFLMRQHPAKAPLFTRILDTLKRAVSALLPLGAPVTRFKFSYVASGALALVLMLGAGTSYAAQSALPGDALYGVKINVDEGLEGALATTPAAQASWNTERAARRLQEAETLAAEGKLNSSTESTLTSALDQATDSFDSDIAQIAQTSNDTTVVATAQTNLQATLEAHATVLLQIASIAPSSDSALASLFAKVNSRAIALGSANAAIGQSIAVSRSAVKAAAQANGTLAQSDASQVKALAVSASSTAPIAQDADVAERDVGAGDASLAQGEYTAAFTTFQNAILHAKKAEVVADAAANLKDQTGVSLAAIASSTAAINASSTATTTAEAILTTDASSTATSTGSD